MATIDTTFPMQNINLGEAEARFINASLSAVGVKGLGAYELPKLINGALSPEGLTSKFQATVQGITANFSAKQLHFSTLNKKFDSGKLDFSFTIPIPLHSIAPGKAHKAGQEALKRVCQFGFDKVVVRTKQDGGFQTKIIVQMDTRAKV